VARAFSDPPMNLLPARAAAQGIELKPGLTLDLTLPTGASAALTVGLRANSLRLQRQAGDLAMPGVVELAEISGSDTFVHLHSDLGSLVAQLSGVHYFELGAALTLYLQAAEAYVFDAQEALLLAPRRLQAWGGQG